ncbi:MAG: hypothetical protein ABIH72_02865 [archaeon]
MIQDRWNEFFENVRAQGNSDYYFKLIEQAYSHPLRYYHTLDWHIANSISEFDRVKEFAANPNELEFALWFHDIIYDTTRSDNEEKSAEFACLLCQKLKMPNEFADEVSRLILLTKYLEIPEDIDGKLMLDIDLSMLGKPDPYFKIDTGIRQEYSWVPEEVYKTHRKQILQRFLSQRIYLTDFFFTEYEQQARGNLKRSIERLEV